MITIRKIDLVNVRMECMIAECSNLVSCRAHITDQETDVPMSLCLCKRCETSLVNGRAYFDAHKILRMIEL